MGIFRSDPQPVQLTPHVPAQALTTGSQPPRIASQLAMAMAVVSMAWPQPGEPHPIQPLQGRSQIAPLTLVYGQQPPIAGPLSTTETNLVVRSWDSARQQPQSLIGSAAWNVPVIVASVPVIGPVTPAVLAGLRQSWESTAGLPQSPVKIVALTLSYGDQPLSDAKRIARHVGWRAWDTTYQPSQQPLGTAAWNVPVIVVAQVPFFRQPIPYVALDWSAQRGSQIVTLTLATGQNPPVNGAITPTELNQILRTWDVTWGPQSRSPNASWNVPPIVSQPIPFTRQRHPVRLSWEPPFVYPPSAAAVAAFANVVAAALDRAIAQSDGADSLVSSSDATGALIQNSGLIAIVSSDSRTIQIITGNSGVISLDSDG